MFVPAVAKDAVASEKGEVNLRPRPRPRPRPTYKAVQGPVVGVTGGEESALNVAPLFCSTRRVAARWIKC